MEFLIVFLLQQFVLSLATTPSFLPYNCPATCGDTIIPYPFGVGNGCFRPGFELTCNHSTHPPMLFLGNQTTFQVIYLEIEGFMLATNGITIVPSNVKNYTLNWSLPNNGPYSLMSGNNAMIIIGCGIAAKLTNTNVTIGECATFCDSEQALEAASGSSCANIGCCQIQFPSSFNPYILLQLQLTRVEELNHLKQDYDVKAFLSSEYYYTIFNADDVYSTNNFNTTTRVPIRLAWAIDHPLTCESAKEKNESYACLAKDSYCTNATILGYNCRCPSYSTAYDDRTTTYYRSDPGHQPSHNPYIPGGCPGNSSTKPNLECQKKCGKIDIPFPFGMKQGCYGNPNFVLFCDNTTKPDPTLLFAYGYNYDTYKVDEILIEEGLIRVDTTKETMEQGYEYHSKPFFFHNDSGLINWGIDYITCDQAKGNNNTYACVSEHSSCVTKNLTESEMGYHCKCSQGYQGNPYIAQGCQDIDECLHPEMHCPYPGTCYNFHGGYICCPAGTSVNPTNNKSCVTQAYIQPNSRNFNVGFYTGMGFGIGLICLLIIVGLIFGKRLLRIRIQRKLRQKYFQQNHGLLLQQLISCNGETSENTEIFTLEELEKATADFDPSRIVGRGGHGTVFKGLLADQRVVAIKKSKLAIKREINQFINEVVILSRINHRNIVKLFGCCLETEVPLLVYEFISNGTLHNHLHSVNLKSTLSWEDRLRIAFETSGTLSYLHSSASISIFHRDVKSANILLDEYLTAKVSDFGASRLIPVDQTQVATVVQGTYGYLDPEYHHTGQLTEKSDVYSFGVILVELLTGELPICSSRVEEERNLSVHFLRAIKDNSIFELVEDRVKKESTTEELSEFIQLAEVCLSLSGEKRPTMRDVEYKLQSLRMIRRQKNELNQIQHIKERASSTGSQGQSSVEGIGIPWEDRMINTSDQTMSLLTCPR